MFTNLSTGIVQTEQRRDTEAAQRNAYKKRSVIPYGLAEGLSQVTVKLANDLLER